MWSISDSGVNWSRSCTDAYDDFRTEKIRFHVICAVHVMKKTDLSHVAYLGQLCLQS